MTDEQKFIESRIRSLLSEASKIESELAALTIDHARAETSEKETPIELVEELSNLEERFLYLLQAISLSLLRYLELTGTPAFIQELRGYMGNVPPSSNDLGHFAFDSEIGEPYNVYLRRLWQLLGAFSFIHEVDLESSIRRSGVHYLERLLRNTASLIHQSGVIVASEPQVYNAIRPTLAALFPSSRGAGSNFLKTAKEYKPDLLIPELHAAVEYKYAESESRLKPILDQIAADAKGYTGDSTYRLFYAVFYVTRDFWGAERFTEAWKDLDMPKNWKGIYVVGPAGATAP